MTTIPYLALTDGTTTIVFANGSTATPGDYSYESEGWAPGISEITGDQISVDGPWGPVEETLRINITGSNVQAMYANVQALQRLLTQTQRWNLGDRTVSPVRIRYIPGGSAKVLGSPYEALLLDTDYPMLELPPNWSKSGSMGTVLKATLRLRRRGLWLNETDTIVGAAQPSGNLMTATFAAGSHPQLSPARVELALGSTAAGAYTVQIPPHLLITAPAADIHIQEAETYTDPGAGGTFAPAASELARGGSVWRRVAGAAGFTPGPVYYAGTLLPLLRAEGQYAVFAVCCATVNNWRINGVYYHVDDLLSGIDMQAQSLLSGYQVVSLGIINAAPDNGIAIFQVELTAPAASTFTIDYFVFVKLSDACSILAIDRLFTAPAGFPALTAIYETAIPGLDTRQTPFVGVTDVNGTQRFSIGATGDRIPYQSGASMTTVWLAPGQASYRIDTKAITDTVAPGTILNVTPLYSRRRGYLIPE